jgi:hypothetical protein
VCGNTDKKRQKAIGGLTIDLSNFLSSVFLQIIYGQATEDVESVPVQVVSKMQGDLVSNLF